MAAKRKASGIGAEALNNIQRIDHVALGLRHLLPIGVAHQRVDVNLAEGNAVVFLFSPTAGLFQHRVLLSPSMKWQPNMIMRATQKNKIS